jgi:hypothetical protein
MILGETDASAKAHDVHAKRAEKARYEERASPISA